MSRGMYGEVFWWEVSNPRKHSEKTHISHHMGYWTIFADGYIVLRFDNKDVAELCAKKLLEGSSLTGSLNSMYSVYDIWLDPTGNICYLRNADGTINR